MATRPAVEAGDRPAHRLCAYNLQESERGVNAVGTCVRDRAGAAVASIAVAAPTSRCARLADLAQPLIAVARDVGRGL
jgi:DNA-binding IclR family transcriptional regulator